MDDPLVELASLVERLHRRFLALLKIELDELGATGVNTTQAAILFHFGDDAMSLRDLTVRGFYQGTNAAYSVSRLIESGYLARDLRSGDRHSMRVRVTEKGRWLRDQLRAIHQRLVEAMAQTWMSEGELGSAAVALRRVESSLISADDLRHKILRETRLKVPRKVEQAPGTRKFVGGIRYRATRKGRRVKNL